MSVYDSTAIRSGFHCDPEIGVCYRTLDFIGFPGYRVGDDGSVWSRRITTKRGIGKGRGAGSGLGSVWKAMNPKTDHLGRRSVRFRGKKIFRVHRLVLLAFVGPCPPGMECCHGDGSPTNNYLWNLRWDTRKANAADRTRHGTAYAGDMHHSATLTAVIVQAVRKDAEKDQTRGWLARLSKKYRANRCAISNAVRRKTWKHIA